jgi:hypothetical protein
MVYFLCRYVHGYVLFMSTIIRVSDVVMWTPGCIPCTKVRRSPAWRCTSLGVMAYRSLRCRRVGVNCPAYFCIYLKIHAIKILNTNHESSLYFLKLKCRRSFHWQCLKWLSKNKTSILI